VLENVPPDAGLQKRANFSTLIIGLAGTGDRAQATCVASSGDNRSAIHYDNLHPIRQSSRVIPGVTDSAITEFGIKRQKCKSGISYNGNGHNGISHNSIFSKSGISYNGNCYKGISHNVIFNKSGISYNGN
jgi:hypothetical protein